MQPRHPSWRIGRWWGQHPPNHSISADVDRKKLLNDQAPSQAHIVHDQHANSHKRQTKDGNAINLRTLYLYVKWEAIEGTSRDWRERHLPNLKCWSPKR
ncbi:hypothetical protein EUGRSUZ_L00364 [Eucalyptus grandis]|uniref:Uncharacterized protein n=1 Tax=Eucalyptus grandis TaxID=71139 RepID=A0A058ZVG3_EUCGR|nr:hypothetical protein EUGRSUZ_L00364 [Eucalyptus grandis]